MRLPWCRARNRKGNELSIWQPTLPPDSGKPDSGSTELSKNDELHRLAWALAFMETDGVQTAWSGGQLVLQVLDSGDFHDKIRLLRFLGVQLTDEFIVRLPKACFRPG